MAKRELTEYIRKGLTEGHTKDALKNALLSAGWHIHDVEEAIRESLESHHVMAPKKDMGVFERFRFVLTRPGAFFDTVKPEEGFGSALKFFLVLMLLIAVIEALVLGMLAYQMAQALPETTESLFGASMIVPFIIAGVIAATAGGYIMSIIMLFVYAGLLHYIFVRPLGGRGRPEQTFKAHAYGYTAPMIISSLFIITIVAAGSMMMLSAGSSQEEMESFEALVRGMMLVIFVPWSVYLESRGLERLHDVTFRRAVSMSAIPICILLVLAYVVLPLIITPS